MRKLFTAAFTIVLVTTLISGPIWAKSDWDFQLYRTREINGTQLERGSYVLRLNGNNEAEIYRKRRTISGQESNGKLITKVPVEVRPLEKGEIPKSIVVRAGVIIQILMKKEVVVLLNETLGS